MQLKKWLIRLGIPLVIIILFSSLVVFTQKDTFDISLFNASNIYDHIKELTSKSYQGRQTGSEGNENALKYIESCFEKIGIEPGGVDNTYYQPFSLVVPDIDNAPVFKISTDNHGAAKEFTLYKDYNLLPSMNGGGIDFSGQIIVLKNKLLAAGRDKIKDRVVIIEAEELTPEYIDYVIENQGRGLFCCADARQKNGFENEKNINISGKTGKSIGAGYISKEAYEFIQGLAQAGPDEDSAQDIIIDDAKIKATIRYPIVNTSNIIGKIEGKSPKGEVLLITADIDGLGSGTNGMIFPGAISSASAISTLLEVARVMAAQEAIPYKTVVFIGFNGQQQQLAGSGYYISNPLYPLEKTSVIHLFAIGEKGKEGLRIFADRSEGLNLREQIYKHAKEDGLNITRAGFINGAGFNFYEKGLEAVTLSDIYSTVNVYEDTIDNINMDRIENASIVLLKYLQKYIYRSAALSYSTFFEQAGQFFRGIFDSSADTTEDVEKNFPVILTSIGRSMNLLLAAMLISIVVGIGSGLLSGYRAKKRNLRSLGAIIALSIPDVLIVLIGWLVCIFYAKNFPLLKEALPIHTYIIPLVTLAILPTIYISRITVLTAQDEISKDYIRNAKAKGFSHKRIAFIELLPAALFKTIDTMPTIMTMLLSNLIVMEYLFNYLGAAYYLIYFFSKKAYFQFAALVAVLGVFYLTFTFVVGIAAKLVNPLKREANR